MQTPNQHLAFRKENAIPYIATFALFIVMALLLNNQGRLWICADGDMHLWVSDTWSADNSQHLSDPYSFSHLLHGVLFFGMLYPLRNKLSAAWRLFIATLIEAGWELLENSKLIIDRYREATAALGYNGDTIYNSVGDLLSCILGFIVAKWLGLWKSVALFLIIEVVMILWIRDSLLLNVIMLISPVDAIREWQMGAQ